MNAQMFEVEKLDARLREAIHATNQELVVLTENGQPAYVVRPLMDDDVVDELITSNPDFLASIGIARQQKAAGQVMTLAEVRTKYERSEK